MKDDITPCLADNVINIFPIPHVTNNRNYCSFFADTFCLQQTQFAINLADRVFTVTKKIETLSTSTQKLTRKL